MTKEPQSLTALIEEVVDKSASTAEEIHKSIADLPLKLMEENRILKEPAKEMRRAQDRMIGAIYGVVRDVNHRIARLVASLLDRRHEPVSRTS